MSNPTPIHILALFITTYSIVCTITAFPTALTPQFRTLRTDPEAIRTASNDYGNLVHETPSAVLYPSSISDVINLIKLSNNCSTPFSVAPRGRGHSVRGQAMTRGGIVVDMTSLSSGIRVFREASLGYYYADVGGEQMWIDVLKAGLQHGVAPVSWTDYLYLSVGGTLSNAGISGQSFLHGPQISNVLELDVITGKGDFITCSKTTNPDLFFGVLGGLGQFGIIMRARIVLKKAPTRVKWTRLIYSNFSEFTRDQEHLISNININNNNGPDYVEGFLITNENTTNEWGSSFCSPSRQSDIVSLWKKQRLLYSIELVKYYYDNQSANTVDEEFELLLKELKFIPGFIFGRDVPLIDFLDRVGKSDDERRGELESHPWLNLFIPKSRIQDFNDAVLVKMIPSLKHTPGIFIFYPLNRNKWDDRMSAVTPDEDIFYNLGLLHTSRAPNQSRILDRFNNQILEFCKRSGIKVKEYLPHYKSRQDWIMHFGPKWNIFQQTKMKFDPNMILSPGQMIFRSLAV